MKGGVYMEYLYSFILPVIGFSLLAYLISRYYADEDVTMMTYSSLLYFFIAPLVAINFI
jgi:hypothetical protein